MKTRYIIAALILSLFMTDCAPKVGQSVGDKGASEMSFRSEAPAPGPARKIEIGTSETFTLVNGLRVIVVENRKRPVISYRMYIDRDPLVEGEIAGMTGMVGDLMSRGTKTRTKAEIDEQVDFVGGSLSTNARGGFASSLTRHSDTVLEIFADVLLNPTFPEDEFEKIKTQTISALQQNKDNPDAIAANVSNALVFGKEHPYGEITNETTVQNVSIDDCKAYYSTYFKPNAAYMVVVGDISPEEARKKISKYFGQWKQGDVPVHTYPLPPEVEKTRVNFVDKAGAVQSVIRITYPVVLQPGSEDVIKARVMNTILGSGFSGRLFRNLREDKGFTYGAYSSLGSDELVGSFTASASVRNEVTDSAVTEFLYELDKLRSEPVTDSELELAKNYIAGSFARSLESPQTVANFALNTFLYNLPEDYYATYLEKLEAVTKEDVMAMARKYIRPENANIIIVGNQDEVSEKLVRFDLDDGKIAFYDIYANEKADAQDAGDVTAEDIINAYIEAIGGEEALGKVQSLRQESSMSMMGQTITVVVQHAAPNKFSMEMSMPGMTVMKQVFDGQAGYVEQMGQKTPVEGDDLVKMALQARMTPELEYFGEEFTLEVAGIEDLEGEKAYKVIVNGPAGKSTEYYSVDTGYKLKSIEVQEAQGQSVTVTTEYSDYQEVDGIMLPHIIKISGMGPMPFEMKTEKVELNVTIEPSVFEVNE
ncbi:MAG: pitrilysin family protein [Saprospiraceae bacterium]|nr:pitrilysin family protein [Saprospiraceae bacterium]